MTPDLSVDAMRLELAARAAELARLRAAVEKVYAAGRPHGTNHAGVHCECEQCEAWDSCVALRKSP